MRRYGITIEEQGEPCVVEEDLRIALGHQGIEDAEVDQAEDDYFTVDLFNGMNEAEFKAALENLDGASRCKVSIERLI